MPAILVAALLASATAAAAAPPPMPEFVDGLIQSFSAAPPTYPPARILRYDYRGRDVYFVPARCCDVPSALYDADGRRLCEPDGGFVGGGDGQCPDFFEQRRNETLIWRDPRRSR